MTGADEGESGPLPLLVSVGKHGPVLTPVVQTAPASHQPEPNVEVVLVDQLRLQRCKTLSAIALSQQFPLRLTLHVIPWRRNAS